MTTIPARLLLRALAYVYSGRADWLRRKVADNAQAGQRRGPSRRAPTGDTTAGRLAGAHAAARWGSVVGAMSHRVASDLRVPADVAALLIARATGDLAQGDELRALTAGPADPGLAQLFRDLVAAGVLPAGEIPTED
jgi:hypothetical protein